MNQPTNQKLWCEIRMNNTRAVAGLYHPCLPLYSNTSS